MSGRAVPAAILLAGALAARPAAAWNPIKSAGRDLGAGAVEAIQPALAATIDHTFVSGHELVADVDKRLAGQVERAGTLATRVLSDADEKVRERITQIDGTLERRIVQIDRTANGVVENLDTRIKQDIDLVDNALRARVNQIGGVVQGALAQANDLLAQRIEQLDEEVGKRLGNVDVIASKQRLAVEQTLLRVAVLVGLVVFVVIVLVRLWRRYGELVEATREKTQKAPARREIALRLGASLGLQLGAAAVAAGVLLVLYRQLPLGAAHEAEALALRHERELEESLASFEFARVRFHASQLELLQPENGRRYRALAAKGLLMRDVLGRPTLLATASGISSVMERVESIERLLGDEADADVLVVKALVLWQVGRSRGDEHEAASLSARALRLRPRGFALAPLARSMVQDFLDTPYFADGVGVGRDAESADGLRTVLASVSIDDRGFPLATTVALRELTRELIRTSSDAYAEMLDAQAAAVRRGATRAEAGAARDRRNAAAKRVVAAWADFDRSIEAVPGLSGTAAVLAVFRLNDAYYTRARWFVEKPGETELAPLLAQIADPAIRDKLAPWRVAWGKRYGALLGRTRDFLQFQEAERWRGYEREVVALDRAVLALRDAEAAGAKVDLPKLRRDAALPAARLGHYVSVKERGRVPYAEVLLGAPLPAADQAGTELRETVVAAGLRAPLAAEAHRPAEKPTKAQRRI